MNVCYLNHSFSYFYDVFMCVLKSLKDRENKTSGQVEFRIISNIPFHCFNFRNDITKKHNSHVIHFKLVIIQCHLSLQRRVTMECAATVTGMQPSLPVFSTILSSSEFLEQKSRQNMKCIYNERLTTLLRGFASGGGQGNRNERYCSRTSHGGG